MARVDTRLRLKDGQSFVRGRSTATARELIELAGDRSGEVITVTHGYLVPTEVAEQFGGDSITAADQPAVITEPGTTTNRDEANNVGGRAVARDEIEAEDAIDDGETADEEESGEEVADEDAADEDAPAEFDPSTATVEEVNTYLEGADEAERTRVLEAEAAGKNRKGIVEEAK